MSQNLPLHGTFLLALLVLFPLLCSSSALAQPETATLQPHKLTAPPPLPATISAFPEQSKAAGCPLDLPADLFGRVRVACSRPLQRNRCCPVLAAWLYAAYSGTALDSAAAAPAAASSAYDMPLLPEDTEACAGDVEKALKDKGMALAPPNATCDLASCYCGIRLHPVSCPAAFSPARGGKLAGGESVRRMERVCRGGYPGLGGCNRCLKSLHKLNEEKIGNRSKFYAEDRASKMQNRDCQLLGLTWLLHKDRTAYFPTVSAVLRAVMMTEDGSDPQSCSLNSDGMPLAVDSSELSDNSASTSLNSSYYMLSLCLFFLIILFSY